MNILVAAGALAPTQKVCMNRLPKQLNAEIKVRTNRQPGMRKENCMLKDKMHNVIFGRSVHQKIKQ